MQEILVTIPFNYENFIHIHKLRWSFSWKQISKSYIIYSLLSIILIVIGFTFQDQNDTFPFTIMVGFILLFYMFIKWARLLSFRNDFLQQTKDRAEGYRKEPLDCYYRFNEDFLEYTDNEKTIKLKWLLVKSFLVFKDHLLITIWSNKEPYFILGKHEMGVEKFNEICSLLQRKTLLPA